MYANTWLSAGINWIGSLQASLILWNCSLSITLADAPESAPMCPLIPLIITAMVGLFLPVLTLKQITVVGVCIMRWFIPHETFVVFSSYKQQRSDPSWSSYCTFVLMLDIYCVVQDDSFHNNNSSFSSDFGCGTHWLIAWVSHQQIPCVSSYLFL